MDVAHPIVSDTRYSHFSPLNQLTPALLEELLGRSRIERLPPGRRLFQRDDPETRTLFLLSGQLALLSEGQETTVVRADSREACTPIDPHAPHRVTALARTSVTVLSVEPELLAELLERAAASVSTYRADDGDVAGVAAAGESLLAGPLFSRLPQPHLMVLQRRMLRVRVAAGAILVRETDPAQFYYLIEQGRFRLGRRFRPRGQETTLMEAGPGDGIGESGLIADGRCGITATALEESRVACISKGEFLTLLLRPHIKPVTYSDAMIRQQAGAVLLDVRPVRVFQRDRLAGSINLPLKILNQTARLLDRNRKYIVYADKPEHGTTAAFLLACQGIECSLLSDVVPPIHDGKPGAGIRRFIPLHTKS